MKGAPLVILALLVVVFGGAATSRMVRVVYTQYDAVCDSVNVQEAATTSVATSKRGASGQLVNVSSASGGYYAQLQLDAPRRFYMAWPVGGRPHCAAFCFDRSSPLPPLVIEGRVLRVADLGKRRVAVVTSRGSHTFLLDNTTTPGAPVVAGEYVNSAAMSSNCPTFRNGVGGDLAVPPECRGAPCKHLPFPPHFVNGSCTAQRPHPAAQLTLLSLQRSSNGLVPPPGTRPIFPARLGGAADPPLPREVDNRAFAGPVRNQGDCGGCWAFATAAALEIVAAKAAGTEAPPSLSPQSVIDCAHQTTGLASKGCLGGSPHHGLEHVVAHGIALETDYPFAAVNHPVCRMTPAITRRPVSNYSVVQRGDVAGRMRALRDHGAVLAIINVVPSLAAYYSATGAVYDDPACTAATAHVVVLVGYGTTAAGQDYWVVKNSWTPAWATAGYVFMARGVNRCGVEDYGYVPMV